jgi:hypothetical protein
VQKPRSGQVSLPFSDAVLPSTELQGDAGCLAPIGRRVGGQAYVGPLENWAALLFGTQAATL